MSRRRPPRQVASARRRMLVLAVAAVVLATGCRSEVLVRLDVAEDGSGTVQVGVGLDEEALARIPDLAAQLRVDDLEQAGWDVADPVEEDGFTWVRATKPFATPEEASAVLAEVTGAAGPVRDFTLTRERSLARTELGLRGTVDLSGGLEAFSDPDLAARLDGLPFGRELEELLGGTPQDEAVRFTVYVGMPGAVTSNAPEEAPGAALWHPRLGGEPVALEASSSELRTTTVAWLAVAAGAVVVLVLVLVGRALVAARDRYA